MGIRLEGLAERWEEDGGLRRRALQDGSLIHWPNPESTGIPTMTLLLQFGYV